jgi:hypothetical protein
MKIMRAILFLICRNRIIVVYFKNQPEESSMSNKIERHLRNGAPNLKDKWVCHNSVNVSGNVIMLVQMAMVMLVIQC